MRVAAPDKVRRHENSDLRVPERGVAAPGLNGRLRRPQQQHAGRRGRSRRGGRGSIRDESLVAERYFALPTR